MCLIRRFVNMNYCSEHEVILAPDCDSDIPPGAQASGYVARTIQLASRIKVAFQGSKYSCLEGHLEEVKKNKQTSCSFLSMISAIVWDSIKECIPTKTTKLIGKTWRNASYAHC